MKMERKFILNILNEKKENSYSKEAKRLGTNFWIVRRMELILKEFGKNNEV